MKIPELQPSPSVISSTLESAWLNRWNQRIETALQEFAFVLNRSGWIDVQPDHLNQIPTQDIEYYTEALLLKSSLLRAQGHRRRASSILQKTANKISALNKVYGFRLHFELGIDHWLDHDMAPALENFLMAEQKTRNSIELLFSCSNVLWCLESLDLERYEVEKKVENLLKNLDTSQNVSHVQEQWIAYQMRKNFYHFLKLNIYQSKDQENIAIQSGQPLFFKRWVQSLPYFIVNSNTTGVNQSDSHEIIVDSEETEKKYLWQGSYRERTLSGLWVPSDLYIDRTSDAIDRLYLWTWFWMAKKMNMTIEKVFFSLESVLNELDCDLQSKENLLLLRNSLEWISFLEPMLSRKLEKLRSSLRKIKTTHYPVLEAENYLIQRLTQPQVPRDLEVLISKFPIFIQILHEVENINHPHLSQNLLLPLLYERRKEFSREISNKTSDLKCANLFSGDKIEKEILVNLLRLEVQVCETKTIVSSRPMALLLAALEKKDKVKVEEVFGPNFEIKSIYNLISRIRHLTSPQALIVRDQLILRGPDWPVVKIVHASESITKIKPALNLHQNRIRVQNSEAYAQAAHALLPFVFTRRDVEKCLHVSKATACRMIEAWIKEDKILSEGQAKATHYKWIQKEVIP